MIAGLEEPDDGTVIIGDEEVTDHPPQRREVGFVFQHYAAFKHMSVADNVGFGLAVKKRPRPRSRPRCRSCWTSSACRTSASATEPARRPAPAHGARPRARGRAAGAAARRAVRRARRRVREELRAWLRRLHDEVHVTTIFVTHDQEEALEISEQVVVINEGRVEQSAAPQEVYDSPANEFVMGFVGLVTKVGGRLVRPHDVQVRAPRRGHPARRGDPARAARLRGPRRAAAGGGRIRAALAPRPTCLELAEGQIVHVRIEPAGRRHVGLRATCGSRPRRTTPRGRRWSSPPRTATARP